MDLGGLFASPTTVLGMVSGAIGFVVYIYYTRFRGTDQNAPDTVPVFIFNRTKDVSKLKAKTFDGLVTYGTGGFVENHSLAVDYRSGRVKKRGQDPLKVKKRITVYVSRVGSAGALDLATPENKPEDVPEARFKGLQRITMERSVNDGKLKAVTSDFIGKILTVAAGLTALIAGIAWLFVVIAPSLT